MSKPFDYANAPIGDFIRAADIPPSEPFTFGHIMEELLASEDYRHTSAEYQREIRRIFREQFGFPPEEGRDG